MRIGISAYLLHEGSDYRSAGVSTYVYQLLRHLPLVAPENRYIVFHGTDAPRLPQIESVVSPLPTARPLIRVLWERLVLPLEVRRHRLDVLHGTVNVLPELVGRPSVVTVHDLSFIRHPERFPRAKVSYLRWAVARSVRRATRVIAVSEHTRRDLLDLLGVAPERLSVIHQGVDSRFRPLPAEEIARFRRDKLGGRPYILHVGTLEPRKNLDVLIRAFAALRQKHRIPHLLALVGARGWMFQSLFDLVEELGLQADVCFVDYVPPSALPLWYNGADLFAYPSAYEGFGLPVLEAMACGLPTITTASSALAELAGNACLIVEPGSEEALEVAVARALDDTQLRASLRQAGLQRASGFRWDETARATLRVYQAAVEDGPR